MSSASATRSDAVHPAKTPAERRRDRLGHSRDALAAYEASSAGDSFLRCSGQSRQQVWSTPDLNGKELITSNISNIYNLRVVVVVGCVISVDRRVRARRARECKTQLAEILKDWGDSLRLLEVLPSACTCGSYTFVIFMRVESEGCLVYAPAKVAHRNGWPARGQAARNCSKSSS